MRALWCNGSTAAKEGGRREGSTPGAPNNEAVKGEINMAKKTAAQKQELHDRRSRMAKENLNSYWFKPGQSGNPKGRPPLTEEEKQERKDARKIIKSAAVEAAEKLVRIMQRDGDKNNYDAVINILDRAIGKPNQPLGDENSAIRIVFESNDGEDYSK